MNKIPSNNSQIKVVLQNTKIMVDDLKGFKVVLLYFSDEKVGKMEYGIVKTPLQNTQYILTSYKLTPEYMELFNGEENPINTLSNYVKTLIV